MIEADGYETVYATGGVLRVEPFTERDIRKAVEILRRNALPTLKGFYCLDPARGFVPPPADVPPAGGVGVTGFRGPFR